MSSGAVTKSASEVPALLEETKRFDVVVAGGGMSGIGAAIIAARHGAKVALIQDRPCLGGNGSKEIRVWLQGASGGANATWFRETGLMEEMLLENQYRNPTAQAELWDTILLEKVLLQSNLELFLNTSVLEVKTDRSRIRSVKTLTLHSERLTTFEAEYFIDCTGDGIVGYLAGAPYMTGREAQSEYGESLAPKERKTYTLGGSILFSAKDIGYPVPFHPPVFAHKFTEKDFRQGRNPAPEFDALRHGFWWNEWGGTLDTIHDNEAIKYELLKIAYGLFDWLKNDPSQKEKNKNLTLEWVGTVPGKRESRRFIGDHILTEQDVVNCREFPDAIAFGGWNLDDHAPRGFFDDDHPPSTHTQIPGVYNIPLRSLYSKTLSNLLFAGRNVSTTHVALTSVRVMLTCAQMGEAAGAAAAMCVQKKISPRELATGPAINDLRERLLRDDHHVVGARSADPANLAREGAATATASSQLPGAGFDQSDKTFPMDCDRLIMFPSSAGALPHAEVLLSVKNKTTLGWQLHRANGRGGCIPAATLAEGMLHLEAGGTQWVRIPVSATLADSDWLMLELKRNPDVTWHGVSKRRVGLKSAVENTRHSVRNVNVHSRFAFMRGDQNYCLRIPADACIYGAANAINGYARPFKAPNVWISQQTSFAQPEWLEIALNKTTAVREIQFLFDSDLDRHINNVWKPAPYAIEPDLVKDYDVEVRQSGTWVKVAEARDNYHRRRVHTLKESVQADAVRLVVKSTNGTPHAQVYDVRVY
jgi:hypothetical protein